METVAQDPLWGLEVTGNLRGSTNHIHIRIAIRVCVLVCSDPCHPSKRRGEIVFLSRVSTVSLKAENDWNLLSIVE